jgi:hypothetical protein
LNGGNRVPPDLAARDYTAEVDATVPKGAFHGRA